MSFISKQAKMLIAVVGRHKGEPLVLAAKAAGARGGTITFGRTVGDNPILQALALADVQQDIVFTLMGAESKAVITGIKKAAADNPKKFRGYAAVMDIPHMFLRAADTQQSQNEPQEADRSIRMESGYRAITVITNSGYADDVMAAARKAGATGGTILNAHGTGTEEDVKFFGISLVPEKDMLIIIADKDKVPAIVEAISGVPMLNEPGGGIIYTMNVEEFIVLGR